MPRFSIIVPLYNKAPYVKKTLESMAAQTYTDWECIIVDDGSTDNSGELADEFAMHNAQCTVIHQENSGVSAARNRGIAESKGEYIAFLDADDWWAPTFLEYMSSLIANTQNIPNLGLYATNYYIVKNCQNRLGVTYVEWREQRLSAGIQYGLMDYWNSYLKTTGGMPITSITVAIPRKILLEMKGFPFDIKLGEDFMLWAKIALQYNVAFIDKPLAYYNFDADAGGRAVTQLHIPKAHMLFNLDEYEQGNPDYAVKATLDKLRATGLLPYWLSNEYHNQAKQELAKVQWSLLDDWKDQKKYQRLYQLPINILKAEQWFMRLGSAVKQQLIKICVSFGII